MATGIQWELQMPDLVAGLQLTGGFQAERKNEKATAGTAHREQFHIRQALGAAGRRAGGNGDSSMKD
jgi:hypothetical protein